MKKQLLLGLMILTVGITLYGSAVKTVRTKIVFKSTNNAYTRMNLDGTGLATCLCFSGQAGAVEPKPTPTFPVYTGTKPVPKRNMSEWLPQGPRTRPAYLNTHTTLEERN